MLSTISSGAADQITITATDLLTYLMADRSNNTAKLPCVMTEGCANPTLENLKPMRLTPCSVRRRERLPKRLHSPVMVAMSDSSGVYQKIEI